eukprot:CAMPEP_0184500518 /NCGR_PEP_ID=MMETSP0113_2-20130426/45038_1 /TAXON_ID=91329 /ORGANISM="Norrisiella sphaerica, Strain BC52" /LENGTH=399 /DNA_ID=CAMNT_0026888923 /DNA_START=76 /DNA_END=1275 /DNA_ORIENTATION=-
MSDSRPSLFSRNSSETFTSDESSYNSLIGSPIRIFDSPVEAHYGYRTDSDRGIASSLKELMERFENAQICGSCHGEWRRFKTREDATNWAFGKESRPHSPGSAKSDASPNQQQQHHPEAEKKTKLLNDSPLNTSSTFGYATLYANDEKWSSDLQEGTPNWGSTKTLFVDADGACPKNGRRGALGGIGVYFGPNDSRNLSEPLPGHPQTNQRAELMSLIRAVEILRREGKSTTPVCLRSDSRYAVSGLTEWVPKWKRNGWTTARGTEVKNQDLWRTLDSEIAKLGTLRRVHLVWVKAHAGDRRNEEADRLATEGVRKAEAMRQRLLASLPLPTSSNLHSFNVQGQSQVPRRNHLYPSPAARSSYNFLDKKPSAIGGEIRKSHSSLFSFDNKSAIGRHPVW